ncbi:hypothetical protein PT974_05362 [Cladobotryum mycophilum]|uniref:Uncharacterized protein n=1 Tax=Cladobotryum mycophilum TaxID=491253 RepID=A0ABR0SJD5_9HYPO
MAPRSFNYRLSSVRGFHYKVIVAMLTEAIFLSLILASCTTSKFSGVYLISLYYSPADPFKANSTDSALAAILVNLAGNQTSLQVRAGYMGVCASLPFGDWTCSTQASSVASVLRYVTMQASASNVSSDPLNLIGIAQKFKDEVVFDELLFISLTFGVLEFLHVVTIPLWYSNQAPRDSEGGRNRVPAFAARRVSRTTLVLLGISALMTCLTVFWQHLSSAAAIAVSKRMTAGVVKGHVGSVSMGLGWAAVFLNFSIFLAVFILERTIRPPSLPPIHSVNCLYLSALFSPDTFFNLFKAT